jgi:hypothetical protein
MDLDLKTINEWKQLGYYYEYDKDFKQWRLYGSKDGLRSLVNQLDYYINNHANNSISEHIHLGPYNYLKILTWHNAVITEKHIGGTLSELKMFKELVDKKLLRSKVGEIFKIGSDYSPDTSVTILFIIMTDNFDPSFIEFGK